MQNLLLQGINLQLANVITGINDPTITETFMTFQQNPNQTTYSQFASEENAKNLCDQIIQYYGSSSILFAVNTANDAQATEAVYTSMASTINQIEIIVLAVIIIMVVIIILLISIIIIDDSKRLAAVLKSLGYSDRENATSFLAIYIPIIIFGLLIAIPISIGLVAAFQSIIFWNANLLLNTFVE